MSHEVAAAAADLATVASLRAELSAAQAIIEGQRRALTQAQERAGQAEADAAAWIAFVRGAAYQLEHGARCEEIQDDLYEAWDRAVKGGSPGVEFLAERDQYKAALDTALAELRAAQADAAEMRRRIVEWYEAGDDPNRFPGIEEDFIFYAQQLKAGLI